MLIKIFFILFIFFIFLILFVPKVFIKNMLKNIFKFNVQSFLTYDNFLNKQRIKMKKIDVNSFFLFKQPQNLYQTLFKKNPLIFEKRDSNFFGSLFSETTYTEFFPIFNIFRYNSIFRLCFLYNSLAYSSSMPCPKQVKNKRFVLNF